MSEPSEPKEHYLGDGLYASFDGWQVTLRAPRADGDHWVALEPVVLDAFLTWLKEIGHIK
jgi:hypothetical protein